MFPYLVLLRVGFTMPSVLPRPRWALTPPFQPYLFPFGSSAVYFLLHFPSPRDARSLTGTLLCGARTFLWRMPRTGHTHVSSDSASDCLASFHFQVYQ